MLVSDHDEWERRNLDSRKHHSRAYKYIWTPTTGEILEVQRESDDVELRVLAKVRYDHWPHSVRIF